MSFAQIDVSPVEEHTTDTEAFLQKPSGEAASRARVKFGIVGSAILVGAALIFVVAPSMSPASSSIDLPQSVISLDGVFTNPFYLGNWGSCPNDEYITDKEDCRKAGQLLGYDRGFREELEDTEYAVRGCGGDTKKTVWSPSGTSKKIAKCLCKKKDMPDFAAMKADLHKLTFYCLHSASGNFGHFAACMTQIDEWSESDEVPSGDDETAEVPVAPEEDPADTDCWKTNPDTYSGGYARGESSKFDLAGAKAKCKEFGSRCGAVTCPGSGGDSCTVRASPDLQPSDSGEVSYTYTC